MLDADKVFGWDKFQQTVTTVVRFLDDMIDVSDFPLPQINENVRGNRKIGAGVMGFADMLYRKGIPYNSSEAMSWAADIMKCFSETANEYSKELAMERGAYPNAMNDNKRNATLTTIAPTGSIAIIANTSHSIEPNYALVYRRRVPSMNKELTCVNPALEDMLKLKGVYSQALIKEIADNNGSVQGLSSIPEDIQKVFVTAMDISPDAHVEMQAAWQTNGVDNAVSKTCNASEDTTPEEVSRIYMKAYNLGCKGITFFRTNSRENVLQTGSAVTTYAPVKPAMEEAQGKRSKKQTGCGSIWISLFTDDEGKLREIFTSPSKKSGGCQATIEALSREVSLGLRANIDPAIICDQLRSPMCKTSVKNVGERSCGAVMANAIEEFIGKSNYVPAAKHGESCPECGEAMSMVEGCATCYSCGYSKCS